MENFHMVGNPVIMKVIALSSLLSAFFFTSLAIDANVFEILFYYILLGLSTWSWMNHWKQFKSLVWFTCTFICAVVSIAVFNDSTFAALGLTIIAQAFVYILDSLDGEL